MRVWLRILSRVGLCGALGYGGALAILHVLHNPHVGPLEAVGLLLVFSLLYGAWATAAAAVASPLALALARRRGGDATQRGIELGLWLFQAPFWGGFLLYGLTYDQGPLGPLATRGGMVAWVLTLGVLAILLAALLARVAARWLVPQLSAPRRLAATFAVLAMVCAAIGAGQSLLDRSAATGPPEALPRRTPTGVKVAIIALDGASWDVVDALRPSLPTFERLAGEGVRADLATYPDSNSAVIWASVYSGSRPEQHRVGDFYTVRLWGFPAPGIFPVHRTYFKELVGPLERLGLARRITVSRYSMARPPFWEILDHFGVSTGIADGYYYSLPVQAPATANSWRLGYTLDEWLTRAGEQPDLLEQAPLWVAPVELAGELAPLVVGAGGDFFWQSRATLHMLESRSQPEVLSFYCHQPDAVSHLAWKWWQPQYYFGVREADVRARGDEVPAMHRSFDEFLAGLRDQLGSETVVFVVSDHGQSPTMLHSSFFTQHRHGPSGLLLLEGGPVVAGAAVEAPHVDDILPTVYWLLGYPVPQDGPGRVWIEAFDPAFVAANPVRTHPSFRGFGAKVEAAGAEVGFNEEEIEKLKALGYI